MWQLLWLPFISIAPWFLHLFGHGVLDDSHVSLYHLECFSGMSNKTLTQAASSYKKMSKNSWNLEVSRYQAQRNRQWTVSPTTHFSLSLCTVISGTSRGRLLGASGCGWQPELCASCSNLEREKEEKSGPCYHQATQLPPAPAARGGYQPGASKSPSWRLVSGCLAKQTFSKQQA